ncbi:MAG: thiamine phosphate synthase [Desulfopila sp.]
MQKPQLPVGIYGMTAEKFSRGRTNLEVAQQMIDGGIRLIQYREKRSEKSAAAILAECAAIREYTRQAGVLFIVNDYVDIAMLVDADGVHVGQDDLPVPEVRRLIGFDKLIGLSTHSPAQLTAAIAVGADYIGVGPIFTTATKGDAGDPVGLRYLDHVRQNSPLPFVAIGGIKEQSLNAVLDHGARTVCLVSEIVGSDNITETVRRLQSHWT